MNFCVLCVFVLSFRSQHEDASQLRIADAGSSGRFVFRNLTLAVPLIGLNRRKLGNQIKSASAVCKEIASAVYAVAMAGQMVPWFSAGEMPKPISVPTPGSTAPFARTCACKIGLISW